MPVPAGASEPARVRSGPMGEIRRMVAFLPP